MRLKLCFLTGILLFSALFFISVAHAGVLPAKAELLYKVKSCDVISTYSTAEECLAAWWRTYGGTVTAPGTK